MDFRSPSIKHVADFFLFSFQSSTIDGYRTAIADKIGKDKQVDISKDENLTRLLDSFHQDKPKGRRGLPSLNLSFFINSPSLLLNLLGRLV